MDVDPELEWLMEQVDGEELLNKVLSYLDDFLGDSPNFPPPPASPTPPPPPPPPAVPIEQGFNALPQPVGPLTGGYGGGIPLGAYPHGFHQPYVRHAAPFMCQGPLHGQNVMQSGFLYREVDGVSQGQYLPYVWPVYSGPGPAAVSTAPRPYNFPQVMFPQYTDQNLVPVGVLNGELVNRVADRSAPVAAASAAPPLNTSTPKKRKRASKQNEDHPYIKKPPNAFMLFRKEHRPKVVAELNISENAMVNTILGQRWKSLSDEEQAKYYEEAHREKLLHAEKYPEWSARDNYGKKRKRVRSKAPTSAEASASKPEEHVQRAKRPRVTPATESSDSSIHSAPAAQLQTRETDTYEGSA